MPPEQSHPGVYVEEVPSGVRAIAGVATSIAAFVGRAARGPTDTPVVVTSFADFERRFGGLWTDSALGSSVRDFYLNGGSTAVIVRLYRPDAAGGRPGTSVLTVGSSPHTLQLRAADDGAWGNALRARVDHATRPPDAALGETASSLFNLVVHDRTTGVTEEHRNVVVSPADHPRFVTTVLENESHLVRVAALTANRPAPASSDTVDRGKTVWDDNTTPTNARPGGAGLASDGRVLTDAEFTAPGLEAARKGIFALDDADLFNLLVIPPYTVDGTVDPGVLTDADALCVRRRAVQLVDPPPSWEEAADVTREARSFASALSTDGSNAALFFPRLRRPNPLADDRVETVAPSGAVAGVIARTDTERGVWKAPAGTHAALHGVPELSVALTDSDIDRLNPLGVNCLRTVPGAGPVVWGARTFHGTDLLAGQWKYLPVRRTALFLEESLVRGTTWAVFEPNDEPLWSQIRLNVGNFMHSLFRQGAFQGTSPRETYFVACGQETTAQADIDLGIVNIHVGFAPLKPAEFVVIRLRQRAGQSRA